MSPLSSSQEVKMLDIRDLVDVTSISLVGMDQKDTWQCDISTFLYKADFFKTQVR